MTTDTIATAPPADAITAPWWVWIERVYEHDQDARDVAVGPFATEEAAALAGNESALVEYILSPSGGGGTDCYWNQVQPNDDEHEVQIIDPTNHHHTGEPEPTPPSLADALSLAILALNTLAHPDATDSAGHAALDAGTPGAVEVLAQLRDRLAALPPKPAPHPYGHEDAVVVVFDVNADDEDEGARALASVLGVRGPVWDLLNAAGVESWWFPERHLKHIDGNDNDAMTLVADEGEDEDEAGQDRPAPVPAPVG